ncbi:MAG: hypothetical protein ACOYK9_02305 [Chlamydiia bacterium]
METLQVKILEPKNGISPIAQVLFFTTTATEALEVDPLCKPTKLLHEHPVRIISFDLPFHSETLSSFEGVRRWTKHIEETGHDPLEPFLEKVARWTDSNLDPTLPVGLMGISRGAFIAAHLAYKLKKNLPLTLFAPMMHLAYPRLWEHTPPAFIHTYQLDHLRPFLKDCPIYLSMGNNDEMVDTDKAIVFYQELIREKRLTQGRHIPIELHLFPSIGMYGHGTSDPIFHEGVQWMLHQLKK